MKKLLATMMTMMFLLIATSSATAACIGGTVIDGNLGDMLQIPKKPITATLLTIVGGKERVLLTSKVHRGTFEFCSKRIVPGIYQVRLSSKAYFPEKSEKFTLKPGQTHTGPRIMGLCARR